MSQKPIFSGMKKLRPIVLLVCVLAGGCATTDSTDGPPAAVSFEPPTSTSSTVAETDEASQTNTATANTSDETLTTSPSTEAPLVNTQDPTETNTETVDPLQQLLTRLVRDRGAQRRGEWAAPEFERVTCAPLTETGPVLELAESSNDSVDCYPAHWWTQDQTQVTELDQEQIEALGDNYETLFEIENPDQFFEEFEEQPIDHPAEFYGIEVVAEGVTTESFAAHDPDVEVRPFDSSNYTIGADEIGLICITDSDIGNPCVIIAILDVTELQGSSLAIIVVGTDPSGVAQADALAANLQPMLESFVLDNE